jgi:hypothetical protein
MEERSGMVKKREEGDRSFIFSPRLDKRLILC